MTDSRLARRMAAIRPSPTAAVSDTLRAMQAAGRSVINLGEGELDFDSPETAKLAAMAAIETNQTKYTSVAGTDALKDAVRRKFARENGIEYGPDEVIVGTGGKQLIFNAMLATLDVGDEVLIPAPYWVSYPDIVALTGATPVTVETTPEEGFKLTPARLRERLTTQTRWVVLNSPNNPTGAVYSEAELEALLAELDAWPNVLILADDIYEHLVYEGYFATPAACRPDLKPRILTVNGVSKVFSMTGWRIGYAGGPQWLIRAMTTLQSQSTTNAASISQAAAAGALVGSLSFLEPRVAALRARRDLAVARINAIEGLHCDSPAGAFYLYIDCAALTGRRASDGEVLRTDVDVAAWLVKEAGVGLVPGTAFGLSPWLRLAYGVPTPTLKSALDAIEAACQRLVD